ncbi:MAG: metallophosphoesterase family protein [Acidilobus sp.]
MGGALGADLLIAHMADVHLGARKYGERAIYEDVSQAFEESLNEVIRERARYLVIAGDLFDSPHPDNWVLAFAVRKLKDLASRGVKVIAARGEHDTPGRREPSPLDVLSEAVDGFYAPRPGQGAKVEEIVGSTTLRLGEIAFLVYPFIKVSAEERRDIYANILRPAYERASRELRSSGVKTVFVAHFAVEPIFRFDAVAAVSELPLADYVALGHVHRRCVRCVTPPDRQDLWYAYPGSLYPLDVSEAAEGHKRGPIFVDLSGGEPSFNEVDVRVRRHFVVEADVRDPKEVDRVVRAAVSKVSRSPGEREPLVHLKLNVGVKVPSRLVELAASRVARERNLIIVPHVTRVPEEQPSAGKGAGRESLSPVDVFRDELRLDEFTAKVLLELVTAASEGSEEAIEGVLEKLISWPRSMEQLRGLMSQ